MFKPKICTTLKNYNKEQFINDVIAGIIVGIIALPLSIALAIASGVSPEKGLYTAIIGGFLISFLGGSRVQIGGPTGAFVIIVYNIINKYGLDGLLIVTIMAGIILILFGFMRFGNVIKYIPYPITTGFTSGIGVVIITRKNKDFFGMQIKDLPADFVGKIKSYFLHIDTINYQSLIIGIISIIIIILWSKINKKIPGSIVAILITTLATIVLKLDIETIGSKFGEISSSLPSMSFPNVAFEKINLLIRPAFTVAILAGIESLLSAVVSDGMIGGKHKSNMELVALGIANIGSAMFGGIPVTGAIARTAANVKNGGRTPIAGIVHSITLLIILVLFMPYAKLIPLSTLAAVLIIVAYNMSDWRVFASLFKAPKSDITVLLITFLLTVFADLVVAIEIGMVLAAFLFMKRMTDVTNVKSITDDILELDENEISTENATNKNISIYEINGPFFFGATSKFIEAMNQMQSHPKVLILKMKNVPSIDATGYQAFYKVYKRCKKNKTKIILSNLQEQPLKTLQKYRFIEIIGEDFLCDTLDKSLKKAYELL